jgi:hypothetical protein
VLYIERWLTAPMERDGELVARTRGTPQCLSGDNLIHLNRL